MAVDTQAVNGDAAYNEEMVKGVLEAVAVRGATIQCVVC